MTVDYRCGDVRDVMATIADGSVDLIASSPPFLALRSYLPSDHESKGDEIGSERNPAEYIDMLLGLTAEWGRVLAPHGSIAIELGDTYSGHDNRGSNPDVGKHEAKFNSVTTGEGWPRAKCLALIPQLYAVALAYGINPLTGAPSPAGRWLVRNCVVWHRPNPAVGALGDKVRPSTSYIVIATRSAKRWFDLTAVRTPTTGHGYTPGSPRDEGDESTLRNWANGLSERYATHAGAPPLDAWFDQYDGTHDTWTLTTQPSSLCHYAMWPAKLAERLILMMCPREVCRVCGEPRRRVERMSYTNRQGPRPLGDDGAAWRGSRNANKVSMSQGKEPATAHPETLGWTDCSCVAVAVPNGWGFWGDYRPGLVLDPFCGSGTSLAVADLHGRDAIGVDIDARNADIYPRRYDEVKRSLYGTAIPDPAQGVLL